MTSKRSRSTETKPRRQSKALKRPDPAVLEQIPFPSDHSIQPGWIADRFPAYAEDHGMAHELTSVRTAEHAGHTIKITTSYQIEIDGQSVHFHAMVGNDGQIRCHTTPYETYRSAIDLVIALIDRFAYAFPQIGQCRDKDEATKEGRR